jgi:hypothetical protein
VSHHGAIIGQGLVLDQTDTRKEDMAKVAPFHTDTDPEDPVYHDDSACPYGQEIKRNGNAKPGPAGRRRCDWCASH